MREIHLRKTGALIGAALVLGALAGGAAGDARAALARASAATLGLAFQIHDDLLNRAPSLARLGKRAGTDDARGKATYPRAVGEARARRRGGAAVSLERARRDRAPGPARRDRWRR